MRSACSAAGGLHPGQHRSGGLHETRQRLGLRGFAAGCPRCCGGEPGEGVDGFTGQGVGTLAAG
ncbi:hypothetical protein, partial [Paracidovorax cattleyae]|uniref:hypothetical protein n=1 Tax=Paracidovorax cattleyae TaxID=80868 RepID=UPI001E3F5B98